MTSPYEKTWPFQPTFRGASAVTTQGSPQEFHQLYGLFAPYDPSEQRSSLNVNTIAGKVRVPNLNKFALPRIPYPTDFDFSKSVVEWMRAAQLEIARLRNGRASGDESSGSGLPSSGNAGDVLTLDNSGRPVWMPRAGILPGGGTVRQALLKKSGADGDVEWGTLRELPSGGTAGQVLAKLSSMDGHAGWISVSDNSGGAGALPSYTEEDAGKVLRIGADIVPEWFFLQGVPAGGTARQALVKTTNTDYDITWETLREVPPSDVSLTGRFLRVDSSGGPAWEQPPELLPPGGSTGQVLAKNSSADYDVLWSTLRELPPSDSSMAGQLLRVAADGSPEWAQMLPASPNVDSFLFSPTGSYAGVQWLPFPNGLYVVTVPLLFGETPLATGALYKEYPLFSPAGTNFQGGTTAAWHLKQIIWRVAYAGTVNSSFDLEYSTNAGVFVSSTLASVTLNAGNFQTTVEFSSPPVILNEGTKLRLNVTSLGDALYWTVLLVFHVRYLSGI